MNGQSAFRLWKGFWQLADPKIWVASTVPMLVAAALAYANTGQFHAGWFAVSLLAIYLIEIGKNAVNEFVDYYTGVDRFVAPDKRTPFSGGKKTIVDGKLSMAETAAIAALTLFAAFAIGVLVAVLREPLIFWIGMAGGAIAVAYSLPPFKLCYNGFGELAVGITFGPLMVGGMYVVLTGSLDWTVFAVGVPVGFLITGILWINQYPDYEADLKGGKRNLLVRIGKSKGVEVYKALFIGAYASLAALAFICGNLYWLLGLLSIPLARQSVRIAALHMNDIRTMTGANAKTVQIYVLTGIAMITAVFLNMI